MTEKMTIREGFEKARAVFAEMGDTAMVEFFEKRIALTEKKNSAERKPTKAQLANEELKAQIVAVLTAEPATVTDIMGKSEALAALSNQKVSALVNALVDEGKAVKTVEKRKSYFALA